MPRYILIDNNSGYIFGDTADLPHVVISTSEGLPMSQSAMESPIDAARWLNETVVRQSGRNYELIRHNPRDTSTGYHVYRADIGGSDAVPTVYDGQNQEEIEAVQTGCEYVGFVRCVGENA